MIKLSHMQEKKDGITVEDYFEVALFNGKEKTPVDVVYLERKEAVELCKQLTAQLK